MSIWDWLSLGATKETRAAADLGQKVFGIPDASEKRKQASMMNDQIKAYKDQSELTRNELNATRGAQDVEKRRIQEKQIRTLRRNYRPAGILGAGNTSSEADVSSKLGG